LDAVEEAAAVLGQGAYAAMASSKAFEGHDGCGAAAAVAEIEDLVMKIRAQIFVPFRFCVLQLIFVMGQ
jgi:hypothetical protein